MFTTKPTTCEQNLAVFKVLNSREPKDNEELKEFVRQMHTRASSVRPIGLDDIHNDLLLLLSEQTKLNVSVDSLGLLMSYSIIVTGLSVVVLGYFAAIKK